MNQGDPNARWSAGEKPVTIPGETNVWTPDATTFQCPACGSHDTRKSYPKGWLDTFVRMFNRGPYRCRKCSHRFIRRVPETDVGDVSTAEPKEQPEKEFNDDRPL